MMFSNSDRFSLRFYYVEINYYDGQNMHTEYHTVDANTPKQAASRVLKGLDKTNIKFYNPGRKVRIGEPFCLVHVRWNKKYGWIGWKEYSVVFDNLK